MHPKRLSKAIKSGNALAIGVILLLSLGSILLGIEVFQAFAVPKSVNNMPKYGWYICQDLGVNPIPNARPAQSFIVCHPGGWEVFAYCIDQTKPSPPVGTICEMIDEDTFWCEDPYQPLKIFEFSTTPTPTMTPSSTSTQTPTFTTTPTHTPTHTITNTSTLTPTQTLTPTETNTPTPTSTRTKPPTETSTITPTSTMTSTTIVTQTITVTYETSTATPTRTERPKLGGGEIVRMEQPAAPGSKVLLPVLGGSFIALGLALWWMARRK